MKINKVKKTLNKNGVSVGSWIQIGHPTVSEIMSNSNFDWLAIDAEHTEMSLETIASVIRGMHGRDIVPLVRVKENNTIAIRQVLDIGALGVIVPLIHSREDAIKAVKAAKYPPVGIRGYAFTRGNNHGLNFSEYIESANDNIIVIAMIESKEAIKNIDSILAVDGIDGVLIGPYDLSGSYGIPGQIDAHIMQEARIKLIKACKNATKSAGIHIVTPNKNSLEKAVTEGFSFIALGMDTVFINEMTQKYTK